MGEVLHDDGFRGGIPQQRVQTGSYPPQAAAGHVAMGGPSNAGSLHCVINSSCLFSPFFVLLFFATVLTNVFVV